MKFENNDLIIFENGSTGTFVDSGNGAYINITYGNEEGYKPEYHNSMIIAYIRDGVYHAITDKTRRQLICEGIIASLEYLEEYIHHTDMIDKISQIKADVIKLQSL